MQKFLLIFMSIFVMASCSKDQIIIEKSQIEEKSSNFSSERIIKQYVSTDSRHSLVAKTISTYFKSAQVRAAFDSFTKERANNVVLLSDFFYNGVIDDSKLRDSYSDLANLPYFIGLEDLINVYLSDYPSIEISYINDSDNDYVDIQGSNFKFETVSVYYDIDTYPIYIDGSQKGSYDVNDEPVSKNILKLQSSDVYDVINTSDIKTNNNNKYSDLLSCEQLIKKLNNLSFITFGKKIVDDNIFKNPLGETKILVFEDIFNTYNRICGTLPIPPTVTLSGSVGQLCDADRDDMRNGRETLVDIKCPNGKDILRDCGKWCSFWNRNCDFQVDIFIPVIVTPQTFGTLGTLMKVFSAREKWLRKKDLVKINVPITEWLFLEGHHGAEWQYTWTGRHRKRGEVSTTTVGSGFSGTMAFADEDAGTTNTLVATPNISHVIQRANKDCPLGTEIARYCRDLEEFMSLGDIEYHADEVEDK